MNKARRKSIEEITNKIYELKEKIEMLQDEEQEYFDNMPENLQGSERGEIAENAIGSFGEAIDYLENAIESLDTAAE